MVLTKHQNIKISLYLCVKINYFEFISWKNVWISVDVIDSYFNCWPYSLPTCPWTIHGEQSQYVKLLNC